VTVTLNAVAIEAHDPAGLARFWADLLGWRVPDAGRTSVDVVATDDSGFGLRFVASPAPKVEQNRMHFDLTSTSIADQQATVARALEGGGRRIDVGQPPDAQHVVLADPEGNEFCVRP
jgi:predicted enzyme related to lactoylglutathione lyase